MARERKRRRLKAMTERKQKGRAEGVLHGSEGKWKVWWRIGLAIFLEDL